MNQRIDGERLLDAIGRLAAAGLPTRGIARELANLGFACSHMHVHRLMRRFGIVRRVPDWASVDWGDGQKDLARAAGLGVPEGTVAARRRAAGFSRGKKTRASAKGGV